MKRQAYSRAERLGQIITVIHTAESPISARQIGDRVGLKKAPGLMSMINELVLVGVVKKSVQRFINGVQGYAYNLHYHTLAKKYPEIYLQLEPPAPGRPALTVVCEKCGHEAALSSFEEISDKSGLPQWVGKYQCGNCGHKFLSYPRGMRW